MAGRNDLTLYERHANAWWDPRSAAFRSLHAVNEYRVDLLRDWLGTRLDGLVVVDVGCGGGLLGLPLTRAGARIVGVDLSRGSLRTAARHVAGGFACGDAQRLPLRTGAADIVLLADVIEHVPSPARALAEAARLLRPGGLCFVNTISRTRRATWLAVRIAEGLRLVPPGTHDPEMFVAPDELRRLAGAAGLVPRALQGESVDVWRTLRRRAITLRRGDDLSVGYSCLFAKA